MARHHGVMKDVNRYGIDNFLCITPAGALFKGDRCYVQTPGRVVKRARNKGWMIARSVHENGKWVHGAMERNGGLRTVYMHNIIRIEHPPR